MKLLLLLVLQYQPVLLQVMNGRTSVGDECLRPVISFMCYWSHQGHLAAVAAVTPSQSPVRHCKIPYSGWFRHTTCEWAHLDLRVGFVLPALIFIMSILITVILRPWDHLSLPVNLSWVELYRSNPHNTSADVDEQRTLLCDTSSSLTHDVLPVGTGVK